MAGQPAIGGCNLGVGHTLGNQRQDLGLPAGEPVGQFTGFTRGLPPAAATSVAWTAGSMTDRPRAALCSARPMSARSASLVR